MADELAVALESAVDEITAYLASSDALDGICWLAAMWEGGKLIRLRVHAFILDAVRYSEAATRKLWPFLNEYNTAA